MKKINFLIILVFLFFLSGCNKLKENEWVIYKVKQGKHYYNTFQTPIPNIIKTNDLNVLVIYGFTQIHDSFENKDCNEDWSKTFGMNRYFLESHHENSARWAHQCYKKQLRIAPYTYINGELIMSKNIINIESDKEYNLKISDIDGEFKYYFNDSLIETEKHSDKSKKMHMFLNPYEGGDCGSYNDACIKIKQL